MTALIVTGGPVFDGERLIPATAVAVRDGIIVAVGSLADARAAYAPARIPAPPGCRCAG